MINIQKDILTPKIIRYTKDILKDLKWILAIDNQDYKKIMFDNQTKFQGLSRQTSDSTDPTEQRLNDIGFIITELVCKKAEIKPKKIHRFMWNLYKQGEEGTLHKDQKNDNYKSIVYCLNNSDGYLEVEGQKVYDIENDARIFNSNLSHKGVGPTNDTYRLNLNILLEI